MVVDEAGEVKSPCVGICRLDSLGGYCVGCARSRGEIAAWMQSSDAEQREILKRLSFRKVALRRLKLY